MLLHHYSHIEQFDCAENEFMCDENKCIPNNFKCDSVTDCNDGTDEVDCPDQSEGIKVLKIFLTVLTHTDTYTNIVFCTKLKFSVVKFFGSKQINTQKNFMFSTIE